MCVCFAPGTVPQIGNPIVLKDPKRGAGWGGWGGAWVLTPKPAHFQKRICLQLWDEEVQS